MSSPKRKKRTQKKLSPFQIFKGLLLRARLARKEKQRDGKIYFRPLWVRITAACLVMLVSGWFSLVTGAYFFVKHAREFSEVRYFDLALPHRWDDYETARGDYYINLAQELMEEGDVQSAFHFLRVGVNQSPDNFDGRVLLAQFHTARNRSDLAMDLLLERLWENSDNQEYLSALFSALFENQEDELVEEIGLDLLGDDTEPTSRNSLIAYAIASANYNRGNYDRTEKFINDYGLYNAAQGMTLLAQSDWERGHRELAIQRLNSAIQREGASDEAFRLLIQYLWTDGQRDRAIRTAVMHSAHDPLSHRPRLSLIQVYHLDDNEARFNHNVDSYFRLYGNDEDAIMELAAFAGRNGRPELAGRVRDHAKDRGMERETPLFRLIEAHVEADQPDRAIAIAEEHDEEIREWVSARRTRMRTLLAAAHMETGNAERADTLINELTARRDSTPEDLLRLAQRLSEAGELSRARNVLVRVRDRHPRHQQALTQLVNLDMETGNNHDLMRNLPVLLSMRKPSNTLLENAHRHISSDLFLFERGREDMLESLESAMSERPRHAGRS